MSTERDIGDGASSASPLLARAAATAENRGRRLSQSIQDFFTPDDARLDERTRATLATTLAATIRLVENDLRRQAARLLDQTDLANAITAGATVLDRLVAAGVLRDRNLMGELIARARLELLADMLGDAAADEPGAPNLLARLSTSGDPAVAMAAAALMTSVARRRGFLDDGRLSTSELPAELHHRLVWWVAAAIRDQLGDDRSDRALTDAALHNLSHHDEGDRAEAAAERLVTAIDVKSGELPLLLIHAIGERQLLLFTALLGGALGIDLSTSREIVIDRDAALWLALRAVELDRPTIARIGLALAPDAELFADQIDAIMAIEPSAARTALARYRLHPDFRDALARVEASR